jgi:hypothetical protein
VLEELAREKDSLNAELEELNKRHKVASHKENDAKSARRVVLSHQAEHEKRRKEVTKEVSEEDELG